MSPKQKIYIKLISITILDEEFREHDLHILNHQAKWYYENAPQDYMYKIIIPIIKELFDIVPLDLKYKLIWSKPNI